MTGLARFFARNLDRGLGARERLFERDLEIEAQVRAPRGSGSAATAASEAEEVAQDDGKVREDIGIEAGAAAGPGARHAGVAKAVVARALLRVAQHGISLRRFLEAVLGGLIAGIPVG